ncbi:MAG: Mpo1-like protein [Gammaproteobacteria bacterium]
MSTVQSFSSFREFYPFYLGEHRNATSRRLHVIGTSVTLALLVCAIASARWWLLLLAPLPGYALAWVGHFFFEHNRPATFRHPLYSLAGDFVMLRDVLTGRIRW